jgi:CrcB protein
MNATLLLAIGIGGAIGSVGRHLVATAIGQATGGAWPWGTLAVNAIGGLAIGVLAEFLTLRWQGGPELRAFLITGILGGFTTFSAFSLEAVSLFARGAWGAACAYVGCSVAISLAATMAGAAAMRAVG